MIKQMNNTSANRQQKLNRKKIMSTNITKTGQAIKRVKDSSTTSSPSAWRSW